MPTAAHTHYHVVLTAAPAGLPNCVPPLPEDQLWGSSYGEGPYPGVVHTIAAPDATAVGWLPATTTYFPGKTIPSGAYFGYNIAEHPVLLSLWPPDELDDVTLQINGVGKSSDTFVVNSDGIWWMDNRYNKAPWHPSWPCAAGAEPPEGYAVTTITIDFRFTKLPPPSPTPSEVNTRDRYSAERGTSALPIATVDLSRSKCYGGRPVINLTQGQTANLVLYINDRTGDPIDLSPAGLTAELSAKESENTAVELFSVTCTIDPYRPTEGRITTTLTSSHTASAGIFNAQVNILGPSNELLYATPYWLLIAPSLTATTKRSNAPTLAEIRLVLRDVCPDQNFLLDDYEYDDSQIAACLRLPIDEFNERWQPKTTYTTANFPYRYHWLRATCGYLMEIASRGYLRDHLSYVAGGVSVDDKNKFEAYAVMAKQLLGEWRDFVKQTKVDMNLAGCYGELRSPYITNRRSSW